mmetsp:Transcript_32983/g.47771  ORF Transcript_32983/g.47771 Transcript_32983/m.47771 type:complete len:96 (+) Transcript_32983:217-504(+)
MMIQDYPVKIRSTLTEVTLMISSRLNKNLAVVMVDMVDMVDMEDMVADTVKENAVTDSKGVATGVIETADISEEVKAGMVLATVMVVITVVIGVA